MTRDYQARRYISNRASMYNDNELTTALVRTFDIMCKTQEPDGCLSNSIALQVVLRSLGHDTRLCYGLCTTPEGHDFYHAWLEMDGKILDIAIYGNSHFSPFWIDRKYIGPYVLENYEDTEVKYYNHRFDDDWKKCMIYNAIQMGSIDAYIKNAPNNGMWKLIFRIMDKTFSPTEYERLEQYVSKEPL